jgi:hypothetical protein
MDVSGDWARIINGKAQFRGLDGTWTDVAIPEHSESLSYVQRAVDDPQVDALVAFQAQGGKLNNEQLSFFSNPLLGLDSFGQGKIRSWGNVDLYDDVFSAQQAGALAQRGGTQFLTSDDLHRGLAFNESESPAAQAARNKSDGFGDLLKVAGIALAVYTGGTSLLESFGAESAGYLGAVDANAGLIAASSAPTFDTFAANYFSPGGSDLLSAFSGNFQSVDSLVNAAVASGGNALPSAIVPDLVLAEAATGSGLTVSQALKFVDTAKTAVSTVQQVQKLAGGATTSGLAAASYRGGAVPSGLSGTMPTPAQIALMAPGTAKPSATETVTQAAQQSAFDSQTVLFVGAICVGLYLFWSKKHG